MAAFEADKVIKLNPQVDWANKPLREILQDVSRIRKDKQYLDTLNIIDVEKLPIQLAGETKILARSLADLTPNQINANKNVLHRFLVDSNSAVQRLEFELRTTKGNVVPRLLQITKNLDTAFTAADKGKKGGAVYLALKDMVDSETLERVTARGASTQTFIPKFTPDFMPKLSEAIKNINYDVKLGIYTDGGEGRNIAALKVVGGYRNADLARLDISSIDFNTGKISPTATKAGIASGQLSDAALDIVRAQVGGKFDVNGRFIPNRTSGSLFEVKKSTTPKGKIVYTLKSASSINRQLTKALGQISAWSPYSQTWGKKNVTLRIFRHLNETLWGETFHFAKTPVRDMATLRPPSKGFDPSKYADPNFSPAVKVEANKVNAKLFGYMGHSTGADAMTSFGYTTEQLSTDTRKIIVGRNSLKNEEFRNALNKGLKDPNNPKNILVEKNFIKNLPSEGGISSKPIQPIVAEALQKKRAATIDLQTEKLKGQTLTEQQKNIKITEDIKGTQAAQKLSNVLNQFTEKEYQMFGNLKEALPDATDDDIIKMIKSKDLHRSFLTFLDGYKGIKNFSRLSRIFGGPLSIGLTAGITTLMAHQLGKLPAEQFEQAEDSIGEYVADFFDYDPQEIKNMRISATMSPNPLPIIGDIIEYGARKIFPSKLETEYAQTEREREAVQKNLQIEAELAAKEAFPDLSVNTAMMHIKGKAYQEQRAFFEEQNRLDREEVEKANIDAHEKAQNERKLAQENQLINKYIQEITIDKPVLDSSTTDQADKLFRPVLNTEENQPQFNLQGGV
jgi:integrase